MFKAATENVYICSMMNTIRGLLRRFLRVWRRYVRLLTYLLAYLRNKSQTRRTCGGHNRTVVAGRERNCEEAISFQYGADFGTAAVRLAEYPIAQTPVVASIVPAPAHSRKITK